MKKKYKFFKQLKLFFHETKNCKKQFLLFSFKKKKKIVFYMTYDCNTGNYSIIYIIYFYSLRKYDAIF